MTINITEKQNSIEVEFSAQNGGKATAQVVDRTKTWVDNNAKEIVDAHNLKQKAEDNGSGS